MVPGSSRRNNNEHALCPRIDLIRPRSATRMTPPRSAHDNSPLCFGSMWHVPALFFTPCCRVAWSIAYHLLTTYQNTILSSTHTPAPAVVHTTLHALCIHFQHHPHPHTTSHSRNTEAGAVKYTNPFPNTARSRQERQHHLGFHCVDSVDKSESFQCVTL